MAIPLSELMAIENFNRQRRLAPYQMGGDLLGQIMSSLAEYIRQGRLRSELEGANAPVPVPSATVPVSGGSPATLPYVQDVPNAPTRPPTDQELMSRYTQGAPTNELMAKALQAMLLKNQIEKAGRTELSPGGMLVNPQGGTIASNPLQLRPESPGEISLRNSQEAANWARAARQPGVAELLGQPKKQDQTAQRELEKLIREEKGAQQRIFAKYGGKIDLTGILEGRVQVPTTHEKKWDSLAQEMVDTGQVIPDKEVLDWIDLNKQVDVARGGKELDENTATKILQEVGGDKNRARQLAKQRGYKF